VLGHLSGLAEYEMFGRVGLILKRERRRTVSGVSGCGQKTTLDGVVNPKVGSKDSSNS